jgi:hypothetical protein
MRSEITYVFVILQLTQCRIFSLSRPSLYVCSSVIGLSLYHTF